MEFACVYTISIRGSKYSSGALALLLWFIRDASRDFPSIIDHPGRRTEVTGYRAVFVVVLPPSEDEILGPYV